LNTLGLNEAHHLNRLFGGRGKCYASNTPRAPLERLPTNQEASMPNKGFSHVGLSTLDLDKTRHFYETILGFKTVIADTIKIKEGGAIRHIFFDTGRDQLLAFMEPRGVPGVPVEYDAGINRGLGVPAAFYHFAFEAGSEAGLEAKREELAAKGVQVTDVVDHNWAKSIYFKDPNGISLEYCCLVRDFIEDDANMQERFEISVKALGLDQMNVAEITTAQSHSYKAS
jgi:catechol 2,3-dioxygenase-like lactoylglutathione lyase family enzyme